MKFNALVPELAVSNIDRSLTFYTKVLGFKIEYDRPENKFAYLSYQGAQLMIEQVNGNWSTGPLRAPFGRGINFQFSTRDTKPLLRALQKAKIPLFVAQHDCWYRRGNTLMGSRQFLVQDPDGYALRFLQDLGSKPAPQKQDKAQKTKRKR